MNKSNIIFIIFLLLNISGYSQTFTVGSHKEDVLRIQGTPDNYNSDGLAEMKTKYDQFNDLDHNWFVEYLKIENKALFVFNTLAAKNPELKEKGYESFVLDMKNENNLKIVYEGFSKKHKDLSNYGFESFMNDITLSVKTYNKLFLIDKIRVGDTDIELPIPSEFVKIDDSFKEQFEIANTLVPKTNTLLSYYLSEKDFGDLYTTGQHQSNFYILVEVFNELKNKKVKSFEYQEFLKGFRKDYLTKYGKQFENGSIQALQNISKSLDTENDFKSFNAHPLGIYYDSENTLSTGILTKFSYSVYGESSGENIVAVISTITKINDKVVFLFLYKTYKSQRDLELLKATNDAWIQEIEKQASPARFISDFDFAKYQELILAILTLSFLGASYYATKKLYKIYKPQKPQKMEKQVDLIDFTEMLKADDILGESKPAVEPKLVTNPELLKVNRRTRFFNLLIDLIVIYVIAYFVGYYLASIGFSEFIVNHQYIVGGLITFSAYLIQEISFGKTVGKFATKTHVVNNYGQKPTIGQLIIRNFFRLIPFEAFTYLSKEKRGLYDIFSKTYVIKD